MGFNGDLEGLWSYDNEGRMMSVTYPNGQAYAYGYDTMGRPSGMTDQGTQQPVISSVSYGPAGELLSMTGVVNETRSYNSRLQLTALNNVSYVYPAANNGKIQSQTDSVSGEQITYAYDALNRLISGVTSDNPNVTQWGQGFTYDGFGNLTGKSVTKGSAPYLSVGVDATTNRIVGYQYDANGNQTWSNTQTLGYDYDNRMVNADNRNYTGSRYGYDPDNKRVYTADWTYDYNTSLTTVSNEVVYFFGVTGQRMAAYTLVAYASPPTVTLTRANDRVYFGGKLIRGDSGQWADPDRLGSVGTYFPYGETRGGGGNMFATYTRDGSGLDYADQRYYWSNLGRFMTADPSSSADPRNPQSWNRYSYVQGDAVNGIDPRGLYLQAPGDFGPFEDGDLGCLLAHWGDAFASGCFGPMLLADTQRNRELGTLHALRQDGLIDGWSFVDGVMSDMALSFSPKTAEIAAGVCLAQPELCVIAVGVSIYVAWPNLQELIRAIQRGITARGAAPISYPSYRVGRRADGNCDDPDPDKYVKWKGSDDEHWHYIDWNINKIDCIAFPVFRTGSDPGPRFREISR